MEKPHEASVEIQRNTEPSSKGPATSAAEYTAVAEWDTELAIQLWQEKRLIAQRHICLDHACQGSRT